jgi:hypothetical protein
LPYVNPLPKLYHERREDGEKVRFAVKKHPVDGEQKEEDNTISNEEIADGNTNSEEKN